MKNKKINSTKVCLTLTMLAVASIFVVSCKKYDSAGFTPGTGLPTITSVHTWSKTDTTALFDTVWTYDASGTASYTLKQKPQQIKPFDSLTSEGNLSDYYIIYGTNLGNATSVTFNGTTAYFNRALMTDGSIIVQVPSTTPYLKPGATDSLVVTTLSGKAYYQFAIAIPPPTVSVYPDYIFSAGQQIVLPGLGFTNVTGITLTSTDGSNTSVPVTIVSQTETQLVIKYPATTINRGSLTFAYTDVSGASKTLTDAQELISADNAYQIFGHNTTATTNPDQTWAGSAVIQNNGEWTNWYGNNYDNNYSTSTSVVHGSANLSFYMPYADGGWKVGGFRFDPGIGGTPAALTYVAPSYQYLTFWVINTGVSVPQVASLQFGDNGWGQNKGINSITIQPGVWQFFKIPIASLNWNQGTTPWSANSSSQLTYVTWFLTCQDSNGKNIGEADLYFTDVMLVK